MISMMSPSEPGRAAPRRAEREAEGEEGERARRSASIRHFIVCLLSVTVCDSPFTTYHFHLPLHFAAFSLPALRTPLSRLLDKFTRRPIDSFQLSPGSNSISQDLPSSPARLCCRLNYRQQLQLLLVLPTPCRSHSFHTIHSPADVAFVLRFVHKLVTSESTTTKDGG